jgi:hypothetical protein
LILISISSLAQADDGKLMQCNIPKRSIHTINEYISGKRMLDHPMVFIDDNYLVRHDEIVRLGSRSSLTDTSSHGASIVRLTSSNTYSQGDYSMSLAEYIHQSSSSASTSRHANESFYLFGNNYEGIWKDMMDLYEPPPCKHCKRAGAKTFGLGGLNSGVSWHYHGPGFSEVFIGRKRWFLYPPVVRIPPGHHPNISVIDWVEQVYRKRDVQSEVDFQGNVDVDKQLYECTIGPGEILYFPADWMHATLNLETYNLFVSLFLDPQLMVD